MSKGNQVIINLNLQFDDISTDEKVQKIKYFLTTCQFDHCGEINIVSSCADEVIHNTSHLTKKSVTTGNPYRITESMKTSPKTKILMTLSTQNVPICRKELENLSGVKGQPFFSTCYTLKQKKYITIGDKPNAVYQITEIGLQYIRFVMKHFNMCPSAFETNCPTQHEEKKSPKIVKTLPDLQQHTYKLEIQKLLNGGSVEDAYQMMFEKRLIFNASELTVAQRDILFHNNKNIKAMDSKHARKILYRLNMLNEIVPVVSGDSRYYPIHESMILVKYAPSSGKGMRCKYVVRYLNKVAKIHPNILNRLIG